MRGGEAKYVIDDPAFECIRENLQEDKIKLTTYDADKHVPEVERSIRELKERIRCCLVIMKYKFLPRRFLIEMVVQVSKIYAQSQNMTTLYTLFNQQDKL